MEELKPWAVLKNNPEDKDTVAEALYTCLESLRISGILLYPVMPVKMEELLHIIGWNQIPYLEDAQRWGLLQEGVFILRKYLLFFNVLITKRIDFMLKAFAMKIFGSSHEREMKKIQPLVNHINTLEESIKFFK